MKVVITGGAGFVGRRLAERLLARGTIAGADGRPTEIDEIVLFDVAPPLPPLKPDNRLKFVSGDIADAATIRRLIDATTGSVFHFAAVVSGQAEADTDIGYASISTARAPCSRPAARSARSRAWSSPARSRSMAATLPPAVTDDTPLTPQTSYGGQKAMGELLVNDYSRKGYIDGRALRLPTIVVRPGRPNRAASTWASSIIREPLSGVEVVCPVGRDAVMALLSPRRLIAAIEQAARPAGERFGYSRSAAAAGHLGHRRRDGRGAAPRRRRGRGRAHPLGARPGDPEDRRRLAARHHGQARRAASASRPTPTSTRSSSPSSRTICRRRRRWRRRASASHEKVILAQPARLLRDGVVDSIPRSIKK